MVKMPEGPLKPIHDSLHDISAQMQVLSKMIRDLAEQLHVADGLQRRMDYDYTSDDDE